MYLRRISQDIGWLVLIQLVTYTSSVVTIPIITRAFGPTLFGDYNVMIALASYAALLVTFGVNLSGPREIAMADGDLDKISYIVSQQMQAQIALMLPATLIFVALSYFYVPGISWLAAAALFAQYVVISITPQWVFVGLRKNKKVFVVQSLIKVAASFAIFCMVRSESDVLLLAVISATSSVLAFVAMLHSLRRLGLSWRPVTIAGTFAQIGRDFGLFSSTVFFRMYKTTGVAVAGFMLGPGAAGQYSLADRLFQSLVNLITPISQALYPLSAKLSKTGSLAEHNAARIVTVSLLILSLSVSLATSLLSGLAVRIFGGESFVAAAGVLQILAFVPFTVAMSNVLGVQTMLTRGLQKQFNIIIGVSGVVGLALLVIGTYVFGIRGTAAGVLCGDVFAVGCMAAVLLRHGIAPVSKFKAP